MDAPTFFFSLFQKGWIEFVAINQDSAAASLQARIVPECRGSILAYSHQNGALYQNELTLISDVNHAITELCAEERLAIPADHIAPELAPLCHNGWFDVKSLLEHICIEPHITVERMSPDSYFVRCNLQLARGIPDLIGTLALLIKILRCTMSPHAAGPFHITTLFEDGQDVPLVAQTVPNAQTRPRSITIPGDTAPRNATPAANAPEHKPDSAKTVPAAKASRAPAPAPIEPGDNGERPLEQLFEAQIIEIIARNHNGIDESGIQLSLYRFFREQLLLRLKQLEKRGAIKHDGKSGYLVADEHGKSSASTGASTKDAENAISSSIKPKGQSATATCAAPIGDTPSGTNAAPVARQGKADLDLQIDITPKSAVSLKEAAPLNGQAHSSTQAHVPSTPQAASCDRTRTKDTPIAANTHIPAQPIAQLDTLSPFTFHSGELATYFLTNLGANRNQTCKILSLPESAYAEFYNKGYSICSSPFELTPELEHDALPCKWSKTVRRSDTRLLLQLFLGEISRESIGMRTIHGRPSARSIDRIFDTRFDRIFESCESYLHKHEHVNTQPQSGSDLPAPTRTAPARPFKEQTPATKSSSDHSFDVRPDADQASSDAPAPTKPATNQSTTSPTEPFSFALPAHPRYLRAPAGTHAGMPTGTARPLDQWPYPFTALGDQALFLHLLGAMRDEASRALGITCHRYDQLIERASERNPLLRHATYRTRRGRIRVNPELVNIGAAWADKDPMGFAMALTKQQQQFICGWIVGDNEIKMGSRRYLSGVNLKSIYDEIVDLQYRWCSGKPAPSRLRSSNPDPHGSPSDAPSEPPTQLTLDLVVPVSTQSGEPADRRVSNQTNQAASTASIAITLAEWLDELDSFSSQVVQGKLTGAGFAGVAARSERPIREVRQTFNQTFSSRPTLYEDRFLHLVQTYHVNEMRFKQLTGLDDLSFSYLRHIDPQKGVKPLIPGALEDPLVPTGVKHKLQKGSSPTVRDGILIDGVAIPRRYETLLVALGKSIASQKPMTVVEFQTAYSHLLEVNGLSGHILLQAPENPQGFSQSVSKTNHFLVVSQKYIRYYDYEAHDYGPLVTLLRAEVTKNIECSAQLIFDRHQALMEQLELLNGRELFVVIKRLLKENRSIDIRTGKNPLLNLGQCDRHQQVLAVIKEASPASADELASIYLERYGVTANTFRSTFLRDFHAYKKHGTYEYRDTQLSEQQAGFLRTLLIDSCHPLDVVKLRYEAAPFPTSALDINDENLKPLGYSVSHKLIVRDGVDLGSLFGKRIDGHAQFDEGDPGFETDVIHHPAFVSELRSRIDSYVYTEFEPGRYVSTKKLNELFGISAHTLMDYAEQVANRAEYNVPFTVHSLWRSGFSHPAESLAKDAGVKDCFYERLIETLPISRLIKRTSFDGTKVFCKSKLTLSVPQFMHHLAQREQEIEVEDLVDLLADEYGIHTTVTYVRNSIERARQDGLVFYSQNFDALFPDKAAYAEYLKSCINGTA